MRENFYRTQPARLHEGIPQAPSYMRLGTDFISLDDARIVSILHKPGTGLVQIRFVSESNTAKLQPRVGKQEPTPEPTPLPGGVVVSLVPQSAQELTGMLGRFHDGEPGTFVDAPADPPFDADETPGFFLVHVNRDDSVFLFLRSWDRPYALRIHLTKEDKHLLSDTLLTLVTTIDPEEWDRNVTPLDVPMVVGPQPESRSPQDAEESAQIVAHPVLPKAAPKSMLGRVLGRLSDLLG